MKLESIELKPMSLSILCFLYDKPPMRAEEIAEDLDLKVRQIDASVTKSLVRWGFVVREYKLTRVMKREYSEIRITPLGKQYVDKWIASEMK